jgi:hypothetical protein
MIESKMHLQAIGQVASYNQRDLLFPQLLDGDLQRVGLALDVYKHGRIHTANRVSLPLSSHTWVGNRPSTFGSYLTVQLT